MKIKMLCVAITLSLSLLLTGCGGNEEANTNSGDTTKITPKNANQKEVRNDIPEPQQDENGNTVLNVAGQKVDKDGYTVELLKIKEINEIVEIAPLSVTINNIKLLKYSNMSEEFKETLKYYSDVTSIGDEVTYLQVSYIAENKEEKNIEWYDLMNVVTDKGEQIDGLKDIISDEDSNSEFLGKVKKEYIDGYILKDGDINKVKFIFGYTLDSTSYDEITPKQQVEYKFQ
ncbi:hypothetical protein [Metabacillus fastidiosus]|uniref:hypothetical protein n=1 Tax=Metabacillus fastidiosus TaxID=1458 RepID=UPI002E1A56E0|nr:hypothetical protein [Metabacillus fastidiosus]